MNRMKSKALIASLLLCSCSGCFWARPADRLVVHRQPWQMIDPDSVSPPAGDATRIAPETPRQSATNVSSNKIQHGRVDTKSKKPVAGATEIIASARQSALQKPSSDAFVDAVQVYDYEAGGVYEVLTSPGFVTVLRLRPGEEVQNLAAGDTSRWLIDSTMAGVADPNAVLSDDLVSKPGTQQDARISILIKPRRPLIQTNLVIATTERTYLIDLKSVDTMAYHSVVEWTYPQPLQNAHMISRPELNEYRDTGIRNYAYLIKVPRDKTPPWAPVSVFDDGHRVHVRFSETINDMRRPPLFIVGSDGSVRLVNYHVEDRGYVVHELFERAELRLGNERVVIDRTKEKRSSLVGTVARFIGIGE